MKTKENMRVFILVALCVTVGIVFFSSADKVAAAGLNRGDYVKQTEEMAKSYRKNPNDQALRLEYAENLFELGQFSKSQQLLKPLLSGKKPSANAMYLSARIEYLTGHYDQAEKLYGILADQFADEFKQKAELGLLYTYYQTNQYQKSHNLFKGLEQDVQLPLWNMMKDFGDEKPYQIDWKGKHETVVPFIKTEKFQLPVVSVEINGKPINCFIDTGADVFYLDEALASSLGIEAIAKEEGVYAGGKKAETSSGRAGSLTIGDVTLTSVPVSFGPATVFYSEEIVLSGIIGTNVLKQFLATMDYPGSQLILRPRNEAGRQALQAELKQYKKVKELPFALANTHLMIGQGSINDKDNLNLLIDSGLADAKASLLLPKETLEYTGIAMPELEYVDDKSAAGLAGSGFYTGRFAVDTFGLGPLKAKNGEGLYGIFPPSFYHDDGLGFFVDGLVSHQFLKNYKWTIDFDSMKMIFGQ